MDSYKIVVRGLNVMASNIHSNATRNFTIKETDCEINGVRRYLVDDSTNLRVRLFNETQKGIMDAVTEWSEGWLDNCLYYHNS